MNDRLDVKATDFGVYVEHHGAFFFYWDKPADLPRVQEWIALIRAFLASTPGARLICLVVAPDIPAPPIESRTPIGELHVEISARPIVPAIIMLGRGFKSSIMMGFAAGIALFAKNTRVSVIVHDIDGLIAKTPDDDAHHARWRAAYEAVARAAASRAAPMPEAPNRTALR